MTSIKNDAFTIGTAAVSAAGANVIYQNRAAIRRHLLDPAVDTVVKTGRAAVKGTTYTEAAKKVGGKIVAAKNKVKSKTLNAARTIREKWRTRKNPKVMKEFETIGSQPQTFRSKAKEGLNSAGRKINEKAKTAWSYVTKFFQKTNWKTVGKVAVVAAGIAAVAVVAKAIYNHYKED